MENTSPNGAATTSSTTAQASGISKTRFTKSTNNKSNLPPGLVFILRNLPTIFGPGIFVYFVSRVLVSSRFYPGKNRRQILPASIPSKKYSIYLGYILSFPIYLFLKITWKDLRDVLEARKRGAVIAPRVRDWTPGSVRNMRKSLENIRSGYPGDFFREWAEVYGNTYNFRLMFENRFFTTEPDHIKAILATQFEDFDKGENFNKVMKTMLGTGVFNSDGEMWKFHRAMTRPFFSKDRISHFDIFERHAMDAITQLKNRLREGYPVDIQDLSSRFTMDSATEFLFAHDVHSLSAGLPYPHYSPLSKSTELLNHPANRFARAFDESQKLTAIRARRGALWPLFEMWRDEVEVQMRIVRDFVEPIVKGAVEREKGRAQKKGGGSSSADENGEVEEGDSLLEHLVKLTDDETILRDETLNILLAGRDTTTNSITFCTYMLAENPNVLKKLREEVMEKVGDRRPTYDDMREMRYLRAVINETIRLYPAVPFNIRTSNKDTILPNKSGKPFYIPAGSRVPYGIFWMHRRHDLWGPDADIFDPDRFIDDRVKKYITPNPFIFLPFNAGPRICLGQQFAYHETSYFLIRLLQNFSSISLNLRAQPSWAAPPPEWKQGVGTQKTDKIRMKSYLTMSVVGGVWVNMAEADEWHGPGKS